MGTPIAVDTPDYQRGVVSAQKLLATVPANTASVTVGIPPNAETLIVVAADIADGGTIYAEGTSTLYKYAGVRLPTQPHMTTATTWVFDISQPMDLEVDVVFTDAPGEIWFVYADSGVHVTADASTLKNTLGQAYVVPSVPSATADDHPPTELSLLSFTVTGAVTILAAPGAGLRYRIFHWNVSGYGGSTAGSCDIRLRGTGTSPAFAHFAFGGGSYPAGAAAATFPGQGLPMNENEGINIAYETGTGANVAGTVLYTVEAV